MKYSTLLLASAVIILCLLAAGCTQPSAQPAVPPTAPPQTPPASPPASPGTAPYQSCSLAPGPTQQPPGYESTSVTVDRNTIATDPTITTTFNGGKGLGSIQRMQVIVTRSDCQTEQGLKDNPGMGASVTLMGTTTTDRVTVILTMTSGDQFVVIDKDYPFPRAM